MATCTKCGSKWGNKETGVCRDCVPPVPIIKGAQLSRAAKPDRMPNYTFNDLAKRHYVYICRCADGTLYTGLTHDLQERTNKHQTGNGARYTQERGFDALVYFEYVPDRTTAAIREREIKDKGPKYRRALIARFRKDMQLIEGDQ